jgi:hypothetical protein
MQQNFQARLQRPFWGLTIVQKLHCIRFRTYIVQILAQAILDFFLMANFKIAKVLHL